MLWAGDRAAIREDVERWLEHEVADTDGAGLTHADYEVRFGPSRHGDAGGPLTRDAPLAIDLPNGHRIEVAGRIDRVDWRDAPAAFRVIDYKTGSARAKENRLEGGAALQLPLYLLAAAAALEVDPAVGEAQYFYATRRGEYRRVRFTGEHLAARRGDLDRLADRVRTMGCAAATSTPSRPTTSAAGAPSTTYATSAARRSAGRKASDPHAARVEARREQVP